MFSVQRSTKCSWNITVIWSNLVLDIVDAVSTTYPCTFGLPMTNVSRTSIRSPASVPLVQAFSSTLYRAHTPHLTFSIVIDCLGISNTYTLTSQDTCCTTNSTRHFQLAISIIKHIWTWTQSWKPQTSQLWRQSFITNGRDQSTSQRNPLHYPLNLLLSSWHDTCPICPLSDNHW